MLKVLRKRLSDSACAVVLAIGFAASGIPVAGAQEADQGTATIEGPEIESYAAAEEPPAFATPEAAVEAFKKALEAPDVGPLATLLGLDAARLLADPTTADTYPMIQQWTAKKLQVESEDDRRILRIGDKLWELPFPLVKWEGNEWAFDTYAGLEEIVNRRVGENELHTIETMQAYVDAQEEYASKDRDDDGVNEFAQKLVSSEGLADGLYWPADEIHGDSPAGDLDQSELDDAAKGDGYFGYKYRILSGQGDNISGGAYDYVINGNMIAGYGLVAWPAKYAETGVKTFVVNQRGIIYEADLGPATGEIVKFIERFNPDKEWRIVAD